MDGNKLAEIEINDTDVAIWNREQKDKHYRVCCLAAGDRYIIALCTAAKSPRAAVERELSQPPPPRRTQAATCHKHQYRRRTEMSLRTAQGVT